MKKLTLILAGLICALALTACGGSDKGGADDGAQTDAQTQTSGEEGLEEKAAAILNETAHFDEELTEMSQDAILRRYGLEDDGTILASGYAGTPAVVDEIAVFTTKDVDKVIEAANARIESQKTNYASYAPGELPKLENAVVEQLGTFGCVAVCVSADAPETVRDILAAVADDAASN